MVVWTKMNNNDLKEIIKLEILRISNGKPIRVVDYQEKYDPKKAPGLTTVYNRFGNLSEVLDMLDLKELKYKEWTERPIEEINAGVRSELKRIYEEFGSITIDGYTKYHKKENSISTTNLQRMYGSWSEILAGVGVKITYDFGE